jgi:hypothetical protein
MGATAVPGTANRAGPASSMAALRREYLWSRFAPADIKQSRPTRCCHTSRCWDAGARVLRRGESPGVPASHVT